MNYDILKVKITNRCNRDCCFCVFNSIETGYDLSFEKYKIIIEKLKKLHFYKFHINGGEPLIHPQFVEMTKYAKEAFPNVKMVLGTNAILLNNADIINFVSDYYDEICIGCDLEHKNIEYVEKAVPQILNRNNNIKIIINSIIEYANSTFFERLDALKGRFKEQIILVNNNVYHVKEGKPINQLTNLCVNNSSSNLLIQENGQCYRCFNCEVPADREFNIFDSDFDTKVQQRHMKHYKYCAWCKLYKAKNESETFE